MLSVGIRELKREASELIRKVRETGNPVQITYHGKIVARLIPVSPESNLDAEKEAWEELDTLAIEIGQNWPAGLSASEAVAEGRR